MLAGQRELRPKTLEDLLGAGLSARLDRLDVLSRKLLAGKLPGERRSKRRGRSVEFDDFRPYVAGDDLRHIDWNIVGRLDRLFVKVFREEEDLALDLLIDASASMDVGSPSKLVFAARLATALAYVGLVNQNRVSVGAFGLAAAEQAWAGDTGLRRLRPLRGRSGVRAVARFVLDLVEGSSRRSPIGGDDPSAAFAGAMRAWSAQRPGRGITVVLSDMLFEDAGQMGLGLNFLSAQGPEQHDAYLVQVLSPAEIDPAREREAGLMGDLRLTDVESGRSAEVTVTRDSIARYRAGLEAHIGSVRGACLRRGIAHFVTASDAPVDRMLVETLRRGGLLR